MKEESHYVTTQTLRGKKLCNLETIQF
jgi:hypothetical protein